MRVLLTLLLAAAIAGAQRPKPIFSRSPLPSPPTTWLPLVRAAGTIFSGVVLQVNRSPSPNGATEIVFHVEHAMRGVRAGQVVRIREWGGLWSTGERYANGERVLLFLYPKSKLGLTSPVGGKAGRYSVDAGGRVLTSASTTGVPRPVPLKTIKAQIRRSLQE